VHKIHEGHSPGLRYGANGRERDFGDRATEAPEQAASLASAAGIVAERARRAAEVAIHEERRRLAIELHEGVATMLSGIGAGLRAMLNELPAGGAIQARLNDLEDQAGQAAAALRGSLGALSGESQQASKE
jgi:signal transduction histidine kinase